MNKENETIIRAINKYSKVPESWELLNQIEQLEQENKKLKEQMQNTYDTSQDLLSEMQKRINKAIEVLGQYRHYCVPDEIANRENEELVVKAYYILKGDSNDK